VPELFDMKLRALRRDRAARRRTDLFLLDRAFDDCCERIGLANRRFGSALLIGCLDPSWPARLGEFADSIEVRDPGAAAAAAAGGQPIVEDAWLPHPDTCDLVLAIGTLDTVNDLSLALQLIRHAMRPEGLFIGALSGGETLPRLRAAMRAADSVLGIAAPHVHPRIEAAALAPLLTNAGFIDPVIDVDRVSVSYRDLRQLIADLRAMAATNLLTARPRFLAKAAYAAARRTFAADCDGDRTVETFEILHFATWTPARA
jgi:SAM-dependent methyltransferase